MSPLLSFVSPFTSVPSSFTVISDGSKTLLAGTEAGKLFFFGLPLSASASTKTASLGNVVKVVRVRSLW